MASASYVLHDSSLLSRLDQAWARVERVFAYMSGFAILFLMVLAVYFVTSRKLGFATKGYVDIIESLMPLIAIMGVSYVQREGAHIRMDMLIGALKGRILWLFELISVVMILILAIALAYGSYAHFDRSFDCARPLCSMDSTTDIYLPVWPSKAAVPIALAVLIPRLALQIWGYARALALGLGAPVAVPVNLSIAEQAQAEARQLKGAE